MRVRPNQLSGNAKQPALSDMGRNPSPSAFEWFAYAASCLPPPPLCVCVGCSHGRDVLGQRAHGRLAVGAAHAHPTPLRLQSRPEHQPHGTKAAAGAWTRAPAARGRTPSTWKHPNSPLSLLTAQEVSGGASRHHTNITRQARGCAAAS